MNNKFQIIKSVLISNIQDAPYKLNFAITSACNSRCKTCNVWKEFKDNPQILNDNLSLQEIKLIFKKLPDSFIWLSLSGGEPFLRENLTDICSQAVKNISNLCLITIPTNGLLPDVIVEKTKKIIKSDVKNLIINVSLDGPEEIHDKVRGIKGAYRKTNSTYNRLLALAGKKKNLDVYIETTVSSYNIDHLENFIKELVEKNHKVTITLAHTGFLYKNLNNGFNFNELKKRKTVIENIIRQINSKIKNFSPDLIEKIYLSKIKTFLSDSSKQPLPCVALKSSIAMDEFGNIIPCFMWEKKIGNIRNFDYNLKTFLETNKKLIQEIKNDIRHENCPNCWTPCEAYQSIINALVRPGLFRKR